MKDWSRIIALALSYESTGSFQEIDDDGNDVPDTEEFIKANQADIDHVIDDYFDVLVNHFERGN